MYNNVSQYLYNKYFIKEILNLLNKGIRVFLKFF